jgi:hypothetical protein
LAIVVVAGAGIVLLHAEAGSGAIGFLGLATALVPLSYLPNLAVAEQFASYRSIGALSALLALYTWLGLWGIARSVNRAAALRGGKLIAARIAAVPLAALLSFIALALVILPLAHIVDSRPVSQVSLHTLRSWPELATFAALFVVLAGCALWGTGSSARVALGTGVLTVTAFALAAVLGAARNVTTLVVEPQSVELQMLRSALDDPPDPPRVVFIKPNWNQGVAPLVRYDEFGLPSTYFGWVPNPATQLVLGERLHRRVDPSIEVLAWDAAPADARAEPGDAFVDMRKLDKRRVGWSVWTFHEARTATAAVDEPSAQRP